MKQVYGRNWYNAQDAANFDRFIQTYFHNLNDSAGTMSRQVLPLLPVAPHHILSSPTEDLSAIRFPIREVWVRYQELYYDEETLRLLQDQIIREIRIP